MDNIRYKYIPSVQTCKHKRRVEEIARTSREGYPRIHALRTKGLPNDENLCIYVSVTWCCFGVIGLIHAWASFAIPYHEVKGFLLAGFFEKLIHLNERIVTTCTRFEVVHFLQHHQFVSPAHFSSFSRAQKHLIF